MIVYFFGGALSGAVDLKTAKTVHLLAFHLVVMFTDCKPVSDCELIIVMKTQFSFCFVVKRLNAVVEEYQRKYLPVKEPDIKVQVTKHLYPIIQL